MSYLEQEIFSQPKVLQRLLSREEKNVVEIADAIRRSKCRCIFMVARGSSDNAVLYGKYLFGAKNRLVCSLAAPSLFTLYRQAPDLKDCLLLAVSQSGASDDLCQVVETGRRSASRTLVITNTVDSPLAGLADDVISLRAGREKSVAATKTYTAQLMALAMLSAALSGRQSTWRQLQQVPPLVEKLLTESGGVGVLAQRYRYLDRLSVIGRGYNYATAFELSLKIKELAYVSAEPYSSADFRHGPIAVVQRGFPVLLVAPKGKTLADQRQLARSLIERQAELLVISDSPALLALAHTPLALPAGMPEWLSPMLAVIPGQLFAMHLAAAKNNPLDHPRGLRKVTRTT